MIGIVVEDISDTAGHPAVGITITGDGVVTVTRTAGRVTRQVRTATGINVSGSEFFEDHEAPIGSQINYTATSRAGDVASASIAIMSPYAWLSDPLDYTTGLCLGLTVSDQAGGMSVLRVGSLQSSSMSRGATLVTPLGGGEPVLLASSSVGTQAVPLVVLTVGDDTSVMADLVMNASPMCVRLPGATIVGCPAYLAGTFNVKTTMSVGWTEWSMTGVRVAPPALPVQIVRHTYASVAQAIGSMTYSGLLAKQGSYTYTTVKRYPTIGIGA